MGIKDIGVWYSWRNLVLLQLLAGQGGCGQRGLVIGACGGDNHLFLHVGIRKHSEIEADTL